MSGIVIVMLAVIIGAAIGLALTKKPGRSALASGPALADYRCRDSVLTKGERAAWPAIEAAVALINRGSGAPRVRVLCKTRVSDLVYVAGGGSARRSDMNRINQKHTDFVLVAWTDFRPLVVVELDDGSHRRNDRAERDRFIDAVMASAGVGIVHLPASSSYDSRNIADVFERALSVHETQQGRRPGGAGGDGPHAARSR